MKKKVQDMALKGVLDPKSMRAWLYLPIGAWIAIHFEKCSAQHCQLPASQRLRTPSKIDFKVQWDSLLLEWVMWHSSSAQADNIFYFYCCLSFCIVALTSFASFIYHGHSGAKSLFFLFLYKALPYCLVLQPFFFTLRNSLISFSFCS